MIISAVKDTHRETIDGISSEEKVAGSNCTVEIEIEQREEQQNMLAIGYKNMYERERREDNTESQFSSLFCLIPRKPMESNICMSCRLR